MDASAIQNIVLVRSPYELPEINLAGYGWSQINFSSFNDIQELYKFISSEKIDIGRQRNQIARFFNIRAGDIIIVPVERAILIGLATGEKSYLQGIAYGENRVSVNFFKDENNHPLRIPRTGLKQQLQSRLRIRMSVVYLNEFQEEITSYVEQLKSNGSVRFDGPYERMKEEAETSFKEQLLHNICSGNTFLKSGGLGLEALILELIELEGYKGKITYKAKYENHADTDIEASRTDPLSSNRVYIQVKNHKGHTDDWGIKQLIAVEEDEHVDRWMITSGQISEQVRAYAENVGVFVMDGVGLVDWIYARANELSDSTIKKLGISLIPQILI